MVRKGGPSMSHTFGSMQKDKLPEKNEVYLI